VEEEGCASDFPHPCVKHSETEGRRNRTSFTRRTQRRFSVNDPMSRKEEMWCHCDCMSLSPIRDAYLSWPWLVFLAIKCMTTRKFVTKHKPIIESLPCRIQGTVTGLYSIGPTYINLVAYIMWLGFSEIVMHWLVNCSRFYFLLERDVFLCAINYVPKLCVWWQKLLSIFLTNLKITFIHSFSIVSDDRSKASSKTIPPHSAI
jgi:hypothetical protein